MTTKQRLELFVRADECNVEFGTVPDCDCPHEHWHVGGVCLDVHIEEDGSGHAILGNDDWQLEVRGVENLDEMREIAFAWTVQKYGLARPACPYCSDGKITGLPGNACENCMNTGYADAGLGDL